MAFPNTPLNFVVEMFIDGAWTGITSDVRAASVTITRGRQDQASQAGPGKCTMTLNNRQGKYSPLNTASPYYRKIGRNTPLRVVVNEGGITAATRFVGEVIEWPQRWDVSGNDVWVPLEVAGIMRRLSRSNTQRSAPYRLITSNATSPAFYWPCDDASGSTKALPAVGDVSLVPQFGAPIPTFGSTLAEWLDEAMSINVDIGGFTDISATHITVSSFVDEVHVDFIALMPLTAGLRVHWTDSNGTWGVVLDPTVPSVDIINPFDGVSAAATADIADVRSHHVRMSLVQSGGNILVTVYVDGTQKISTSKVGTLGAPQSLTVRSTNNVDGNIVGHVALWTESPPSIANAANAARGWNGEYAADRISRVCVENNVTFTLVGTASDSTVLGPQGPDDLLNILNEAANSDGGVLYETRSALGLSYRTRKSRYNQAAAEALSYSSGHLSPPLEPIQDDDNIVNDATVTRKYGNAYRYQDTSSPLSTSLPPAGVGRYDGSFTLSLYRDGDAYEHAGWKVHLGTVDELRYPRVRINLAANTTLWQDVSALDVGQRLTISSPPSWLPNETIDLQVEGYTETINNYTWDVEFNCTPNKPWQVGLLDDDSLGKLDTAGSQLRSTITNSATAFDVVTTQRPLWTVDDTEFPFDVNVGYERCTVSDIAPATITFVNFGTEAHADNASVSPGLPVSMQAGDLIIGFAGIRSTSATVNLPAGYSWLDSTYSHVRLFWKIHSGTESAPTVTFTGGALGDTTSAELAAFRGKFVNLSNLVSRGDRTSNASGTTAAVPSLHVTTDHSLVLYGLWVQDDWSGITYPSGTTAIDDFTSATGNDQGMAWSYVIQTTAADRTAGTFGLTAGVAAISKTFVIAFNSDAQGFTVTRSVNGLSASHNAGTSVSLWTPLVLGL